MHIVGRRAQHRIPVSLVRMTASLAFFSPLNKCSNCPMHIKTARIRRKTKRVNQRKGTSWSTCLPLWLLDLLTLMMWILHLFLQSSLLANPQINPHAVNSPSSGTKCLPTSQGLKLPISLCQCSSSSTKARFLSCQSGSFLHPISGAVSSAPFILQSTLLTSVTMSASQGAPSAAFDLVTSLVDQGLKVCKLCLFYQSRCFSGHDIDFYFPVFSRKFS